MRKAIFIIILIALFGSAKAQQDKLYTSIDGLLNTAITGFTQDKKGIIWVATDGGVHKFDGYNFEVFQNNPLDSTLLQSNLVDCVFADSEGNIWAGASGRLYIYDARINGFRYFPIQYKGNDIFPKIFSIAEDSNRKLWLASTLGLISIGLEDKKVHFKNPQAIQIEGNRDWLNIALIDKNDNIWIGTDGYGLRFFDTKKNKTIVYKNEKGNPNSLPDNTISSLLADSKGNIIIGTLQGGMSIFQPDKNKFINFPFSNETGNKFNGGINSIIEDKSGKIWVGTERNGLKMLDTKSFKLIDANKVIKLTSSGDSKVVCYEDRDQNLWIGIGHKGIYLKKTITKPFQSIDKASPDMPISNNIVKAIYLDSLDNLWVGTDGGGLNCLKPKEKKVQVFQHKHDNPKSISDNAIITLCEDKNQNLWIGSYLGGLSLFDRKTMTFTNYINDSIKEGKNYNFFTSIGEDSKGKLWIGSMGRGLYYFDPQTRKFTNYVKTAIKGKSFDLPRYVNILFIDNEDNLWVGSYNGLFCWNQGKGIFKSFTKANKSFKTDEIFDIIQDSKNNFWIGTSSGVYHLNKTTNKIIQYNEQSGLCSNAVLSILEDNQKNLWISTDNGLSKFDVNKKEFINYYVQDGLPSNEFRPSARFKDKNGALYFGSTSGLVYFFPDSIKQSNHFPNLLLTQLKIFNQLAPVGKLKNRPTILDKPLDEAETIYLKHSDNSFTIEFGAVDFNVPEKIKYAYFMEGFDQSWNIREFNERNATYTNLNPGEYTFKLKSTNGDGVWNNDLKTIRVIVSPPFWSTWWARIIYVFLLILILYYTRMVMLFRWRLKNELQLERIEREKQEEISESKLRFFTNISHELRTPLTLILAPVEKLLSKEKDPQDKKQISLIYQNALRMLRLFNQLLEVQKAEENKMEINPIPGDIVEFMKNIISSFEELFIKKDIHLSCDFPKEKLLLWFDPDKLDKAIFNLLSNAYKFTPENGKINVSIAKSEVVNKYGKLNRYIEIVVSDSGIGINKNYFEKIFNRFYQIDQKGAGSQHGVGIGLHLTKTLIELHKGEISVTSEEGVGSAFTIKLPIREDLPDLSDVKNSYSVRSSYQINEIEEEENNEVLKEEGELENSNKSKILIIDDDLQILNYLVSELSDDYKVFEAANGLEGLAVAQKEIPDLIISDIMMPEMDGIELCREVKKNINTCHIPVILLTAKTTIQDKIEGLETGADSYIPKPFHFQHLKIRIQKLIELRENLRKKFSKTVSFDASEMTVMSADEKFLQKAINFVKDNITDPDFNIEDMGKQLAMSRAQLYRKIKSLTDQSPSEFVRSIRLKQAAYLLSLNKLHISEVVYQVGFNSPQYFANCFREYFHMSPTEYCQKYKEGDVK